MIRSAPKFQLRILPAFRDRIFRAAEEDHRTFNVAVTLAVDRWLAADAKPSAVQVARVKSDLAGFFPMGVRLEGSRRDQMKRRAAEFGITMNVAFIAAVEDWLITVEKRSEPPALQCTDDADGEVRVELGLDPDLVERILQRYPQAPAGQSIETFLADAFPSDCPIAELIALIQAAGMLQAFLPAVSAQSLTAACQDAVRRTIAGQFAPAGDLRRDLAELLSQQGLPGGATAFDLHAQALGLLRGRGQSPDDLSQQHPGEGEQVAERGSAA